MRRLYDNSTTVDNENAILQDFQSRSQKTYDTTTHQKNIMYGENPRHTLDFFPLDNHDGTVIFIHGGYWQWCDKSDFAFLVNHCLAKNYQCILVEYPLAPDANMTEIMTSIDQALAFIEANYSLGETIAIGHSAGAHLLANHLTSSFMDEIYLLSGIYDLTPIANTHLNEALQLTDKEIQQYSPMLNQQDSIKSIIMIAYGDQELEELQSQSEQFSQHLTAQDIPHATLKLSEINHYNILDYIFENSFK